MPFKKYIIHLLLFITSIGFSQIKTIKLKEIDIPKNITCKGKIVNAVRYTDATGDNIITLSETDEYVVEGTEYEGTNIDLYAYNYILKDDIWQLNWKVYDFEKDCPFDMTTRFIKNAFAVTDLNQDNNAEVWLMYTIGCRSDISPYNMKIIMYENHKKYAMRGENRIDYDNEHFGGKYTFDDMFKQAPATFREFATKLWNKHITGY